MPLKISSAIPIFPPAQWIDGKSDLPSSVLTLIHFWAMSCPACKTNMPGIQELRARYEPRGLQTVAIHMPRGESDMDVAKVREVAAELGITEPCAIDNDHAIGDAFQTGGVWPVYFLFGADGRLKRHAAGGMGLRLITSAVTRLFDPEPEAAV